MCLVSRLFPSVALALAISASPAISQIDRSRLVTRLTPQVGHSNGISAIAVIPGDRRAVTGSNDQTLKVWDLETGQLIRTIEGNGSASLVAVTADGRRVVANSSADSNLRVWELETGALVHTINAGSNGVHFALTPDGKRVVLPTKGSDSTGQLPGEIRDLDSGAAVGKLVLPQSNLPFGVAMFAVSPNGKYVAGATHLKSLGLFDATNGRLVRVLRQSGLRESGILETLMFSRDGTRLIEQGQDKDIVHIRIWDIETGKILRTVKEGKDNSYRYALGPGPRQVFARSEYAQQPIIRLVDIDTWQTQQTFSGSGSFASTSDGSRLLAGVHYTEMNKGNFTMRDIGSDQSRAFGTTIVRAHSVLPIDGVRALLYGSSLQSWDLTTGQGSPAIVDSVGKQMGTPLTFTPEPRRLIVQGWNATQKSPELHVYDPSNWQRVDTLALPNVGDRSIDGAQTAGWEIATVFATGLATVWDMQLLRASKTAQLQFRPDKITPNYRAAVHDVSPDLKTVLASETAANHLVQAWSLDSGQVVRTLLDPEAYEFTYRGSSTVRSPMKATHSYLVGGAWYAQNGTRIVTVGSDNDTPPGDNYRQRSTVKVWDTRTGSLQRTVDGPTGSTYTFAQAPGSNRFYMGGDDRIIRMWDADTGVLVRTSDPQAGAIGRMTPVGDGKRLIAVVGYQTFRVFDAETLLPLASLLSSANGDWLAITPEGFFAGSEEGAKLLSVVRGYDVFPIDRLYNALYRPDLVREKLAGDPSGVVREAAARLDLDKVLESGLAPRISLARAEGATVGDERTAMEATVVDQGGGIGRIEWRVNGVTVGIEEALSAPTTTGTFTIRREVFLEEGNNLVEVLAYNARNLIASTPVQLGLTWENTGTKVAPNLYVVTIGVNDYWDGQLRLNWAVADANAIADTLQQSAGGLYESVQITRLLDADVKRDNIAAVFDRLGKKVRPRDVFMFFIAGHGKTVDGRYYYIPQDFRYTSDASIVEKGIGQEQWQAWLAKVPAKKSILLYDTCESGSLTSDRAPSRGLEQVAAIERMTRAMGRTILSAATESAPALEGVNGHGVFTYAVLDALAHADTNGDGFIDMTELAAHVDTIVPDISLKAFGFRQVPQMKIVGSNFPFAKLASAVAASSADTKRPVPTKATHVVVQAASVYLSPSSGEPIVQLAPGTTVSLMRTEQGWTLVARDGKQLGYVAREYLAPLQ
jgi:WD40 repeat protein/uncharacterized caspase-like protein